MQRAIIDGDKVTGVTTQLMAQGVDTGDILEKAYVEIDENDNFEDIHDRLSAVGAELIVSTIKKLAEGLITPEAQDHSLATHAAKIEKTDCLVDFTNDARDVHNLIRGLSPIPLSFAYLNGKMIKIKTSRIVEADGVFGKAGEVLSADSKGITVACGRGKLLITELVPEGKKAMSAASFVNGRGVAIGDIFTNVKE
jgi:methionyl-tRNA formyltransferase